LFMADPCNDDVVEVPVETPARGSPMIGGTSGDPTILKALAAKVATAVLRKLRKEERLQKEAASAERKRLQQCQPVENASKKRERENESIQAYFASTRNFDAANKPPAPTSSLSSIMSHSNPAACIATGNQQSTKELDGINVVAAETREILDLTGKTASVGATSAASSNGSSSSDVEVLGSMTPLFSVSSDSTMPCLSEDNPDWHIFHNVPAHGSMQEEIEDDENMDLPPPPKKSKKNYELTRKFQIDWSARTPWTEMILTADGLLHMVKCTICSAVRGRPMIMGPKWDTINRHSRRICHIKNMELYDARRPSIVLQQIQGCTTLESRKKVHFVNFIFKFIWILFSL
jgi:hypothetical protein